MDNFLQFPNSAQALGSTVKDNVQLLNFLVILDASADCQAATFTVNGNTGTTRSWDVKVTQYACGDMDSSGPPGCLQYYTETYGTIEK